MMKRTFAALLSLILILGLLPFCVHAGGGGAGQYWQEDFESSTDFWSTWKVIDANGDGFGFNLHLEDGSYSARSDEPLGMVTGSPSSSDEYLISPFIDLGAGQEYTLYYRVGGKVISQVNVPSYEVYVYTGMEELNEDNIDNAMQHRTALNWFSYSGWKGYHQIDLSAYAGKSVRFIFHYKAQDASALWLDNITVYWQEPDELLSKVTALNVPMPAVGVNVDELHETEITFPDYANYTLVPGSMKWIKTVNEQNIQMHNEVFTADGEYAMAFRVRPKEGITITDTGVASVNGMSALFEPQSDGTVQVYFIPNRRLGDLGWVQKIDITVPIPRPGDEFDYNTGDAGATVTNGAPVKVTTSIWYNEWGISGLPLPFEAGRRYFVEIDIQATGSLRLSENTWVYVNGEKAEHWNQANVSTWYACSRLYTMNPFVDVPEGSWYFNAVMWAITHDPPVTGGTDATHFTPGKACTREQIVTFIWAAYGKQDPNSMTSPFTDVTGGRYYKAVLWAVENGITKGVNATTFGVGKPCTREQVVTFLWKAAGAPEPRSSSCSFTDVAAGSYYYKAVLWAVENGITKGVNATTFGVGRTCTRAQVVTFLYAAMGKE